VTVAIEAGRANVATSSRERLPRYLADGASQRSFVDPWHTTSWRRSWPLGRRENEGSANDEGGIGIVPLSGEAVTTRRDLLRGISGLAALAALPGCETSEPSADPTGGPLADGAAPRVTSPEAPRADGGPPDAPADATARDAAPGPGKLIARADWSRHGLSPDTIAAGATWFVYGGAACTKVEDHFRISYPSTKAGGTSAGIALLLDESWDLPEVYVEFQARLPSGPIGPKFYKVHGDGGGVEYANTTYGLGAGDANMYISFGDGTTTGNDVANVIFLDGSNPTWIGRSHGRAQVTLASPPTPFRLDQAWHTFRIRHTYNSGSTSQNETNDGIFYLEIDGVVRVNAVGVFNRHPLNRRRVNQLTFGDWVQNDAAALVDFRNIKVSTGGWV